MDILNKIHQLAEILGVDVNQLNAQLGQIDNDNFITDFNQTYEALMFILENALTFREPFGFEIPLINDPLADPGRVYNSEQIDRLIIALKDHILAHAPEAYDTLKEIADWIAHDKTQTTNIVNGLTNKLRHDQVTALSATNVGYVQDTLKLDIVGIKAESLYNKLVRPPKDLDVALPIVILSNTHNELAVSEDGDVYTSIALGKYFNDICYAKDHYVAVGAAGAIYTSPDLHVWTPRTSGTAQALTGVAYGKGVDGIERVIAVGGNYVSRISLDGGVTWTAGANINSGNAPKIEFQNYNFLVTGGQGSAISSLYYTTNGTNWVGLYINGGGNKLCSAFDGNQYLIGADAYCINRAPANLASLVVGNAVESPYHPTAITFDPVTSTYYAGISAYGYVYKSTNLVNWTKILAVVNNRCNYLTKRKGAIYAGMATGKIYKCTNGTTFNPVTNVISTAGKAISKII